MKTKVLEILEQSRGESVSGSEIASRLRVTRSAVWKIIRALREEGYPIEAATNRGYRLKGDSLRLSAAGISAALQTRTFGRALSFEESVASTNMAAKEAAHQGAPHGYTVIAREQSAGRGRFGRAFFSPADRGIYMSVVLRPECPAEEGISITAWAAVAVCRAVEAVTGLAVQIKWINDLYVDGKKICGILTEASMDLELRQLEYAVVGIGLNVSASEEEFPPELRDKAASLQMLCPPDAGPFSPNLLAAAILSEMEESWEQRFTRENMEEYRRRSFLSGKTIELLRDGQWERVRAQGVGLDGCLEILRADGSLERLRSGDIRLLGKES